MSSAEAMGRDARDDVIELIYEIVGAPKDAPYGDLPGYVRDALRSESAAPRSTEKNSEAQSTVEAGTPPITYEQWCTSYNLAQNTTSRAAWRDARASIQWELAAAHSASAAIYEECAKLCEDMQSRKDATVPDGDWRTLGSTEISGQRFAAAIRALASTSDSAPLDGTTKEKP